MQKYIEERCVKTAQYMLKEKTTIRKAAEHLSISKTMAHLDVSERLMRVDPELYKQVRQLLIKNINERHIRGGQATKRKYGK